MTLMNLQLPLTKEGFWNEMMEKFPKATKQFCGWLDRYKEAVHWTDLFPSKQRQHYWSDIKYHHLPYAMQQGIWIEFIRQNLVEYFEQVERHMSELYDFEEDVKNVFFVIEEISQQ
jgi:hypothetical protein